MHPGEVNIVPLAVTQDDAMDQCARAGRADAVESLYRAYAPAVYSLARRLCGSDAEAEDVLQETFLEAAQSLTRYRGDGPVAGWLKRIGASKALMRLRKGRRLSAVEREDASPPLPLDARLDLEPALARLPAASRAVVWLHDVEGCTHEEIGALMGMTESFSKSQLARAHARLRAWLKPQEGGAS
jgi:RNA polymerase sigma factor (sigma-70 family)